MQRLSLAPADAPVGGVLLRPDAAPRGLVACLHGGGCHAGYFEAGEPSLAHALVAAGHAVLLVERPGARGRPLLDPGRPLAASIVPLRAFVQAVREEHAPDLSLALAGHSIGGALALTLAAEATDWPLAGVAVAGIGDEPPAAILALPQVRTDPLSTEFAALLLGPESSYDWRGLARLRKVASPWHVAERQEVLRHWPEAWRALAPRIRVPVQLRLAAAEKIWVTGEAAVRRMATALTSAPTVDAAVLPEGGHLYEFHKRGPELVAAQVAFLDRVLTGA